MCLYPKLIKNKKYTPNKKNKGVVPTVPDERVLYVPVGCGKCIECLKQKKRMWQIRMMEEIYQTNNPQFITLTFTNESILNLVDEVKIKNKNQIFENELATLAVRRYLERHRKKYGKSLRHWLVTELGHEGTERIHLHGFFLTDKPEEIEKEWSYGMVWIGDYTSEKTINYIVKYINKLDIDHKGYVPKVLCSKGIGSNYLNKLDSKLNQYKALDTREYYRLKSGYKVNLPIYYRNKLYTDEQREKLWLNLLDKNERWVCGEKIKADDEKTYIEMLKYYQQKNKRLGYGDDSKEWSKESYINKNRKMQAIKRYLDVNNIKRETEKREKRRIIAK